MSRTPVRASNPIRPTFMLKVKEDSFLIGEPLEELVEADGFGLVGFHLVYSPTAGAIIPACLLAKRINNTGQAQM